VRDLLLLTRMLANRELDPTGALVSVDSAAVLDAWQKLRSKYPDQFAPPSTGDQLAWHRQEAEACEEAGQWFAARWHLDRLMEAEPANRALRARRARACAALGE